MLRAHRPDDSTHATPSVSDYELGVAALLIGLLVLATVFLVPMLA